MFEQFFPDEQVNSTYDIDFETLYEEGYRGILFDIDNTLVEHGQDADERAKSLFSSLQRMGFDCCLISNNKKKRVSRFNEEIGVHTIFNAHKPAKKNYYYAMELMGTNLETTVFVGDQLFTDVYGAKRIGMRNILVKPISKKEEFQIVLKRYLERPVLGEFRRKRRKKKADKKEQRCIKKEYKQQRKRDLMQ